MNDSSECGCEKNGEYEIHYCGEMPPYHFGKHVCLYCGFTWVNE